jgi:hypothetical protein
LLAFKFGRHFKEITMSSDSGSGTSNSNMTNSGEGTRPTTDGGVDNMGGADTFTPGRAKSPDASTPQPHEKMTWKRQGEGSDDAAEPSPAKSDN